MLRVKRIESGRKESLEVQLTTWWLRVYDSAPDKEFEELELWRREVIDSVWRSATFKILSARELIEPRGDGECGKLGGVSLGRMFDMLLRKLDCGGIVVGRGGA